MYVFAHFIFVVRARDCQKKVYWKFGVCFVYVCEWSERGDDPLR